MVYDPTTQVGIPRRPAAAGYVQYPYGASESPRAPRVGWGAGSPEAVVTGIPGDAYHDQTNGAFYFKVTGTGNTGWVPGSGRTIIDGFWQNNIAANQAATTMTRFNNTTPQNTELNILYAPRAGIVTGIYVNFPPGVTGGQLTVQVAKNGSTVIAKLRIDQTHIGPGLSDWHHTDPLDGSALAGVFAEGDSLIIQTVSNAGFLPNGTGDLLSGMELMFTS